MQWMCKESAQYCVAVSHYTEVKITMLFTVYIILTTTHENTKAASKLYTSDYRYTA